MQESNKVCKNSLKSSTKMKLDQKIGPPEGALRDRVRCNAGSKRQSLLAICLFVLFLAERGKGTATHSIVLVLKTGHDISLRIAPKFH